MAGLVWRVENLIVEDREVQGKTKADWVGWGKVGLSNFGSILVSLKRLVGGLLALITSSELSKVTVVVTLPVIANRVSGLRISKFEVFTHILW